MNVTIEQIREGFAQEVVAAAARIKSQFGLPVEEAMVGLHAAISLFEEGARNAPTPRSEDHLGELRATGASLGVSMYKRQHELLEEHKKASENRQPSLGDGATLGMTAGDETAPRDDLPVAGPGAGSGLVDANGGDVRPDALTIEASQIIASTIGDGVMGFLFPMGMAVHPLDSLAFCAATLEFIEHRMPKDVDENDIRKTKLHAASEMKRALRERKGGVIKITDALFGPSGSRTTVKEPSGLVGPDGRPL